MRTLLAICLLSGCMPPPAQEEGPWPGRSLALEMWGGPVGQCEDATLHIRYVPSVQVMDECGTPGCFFFTGEIWIAEEQRRDRGLLAHELGHWLMWCSGLDDGSIANHGHDHSLFVDAVQGMVHAR